jgi:hypothetical protein
MKRISMFKTMTLAGFLVVGISLNGFSQTKSSSESATDKAATDALSKQLMDGYKKQAELDSQKEDKNECKTILKKRNESQDQFIGYCKDEDLKKDSKGNLTAKAVTECTEYLKECEQTAQEEMPFASLTNLMGMPAIGDMTSASEGTCSKYSSDKLETLIEKAKSNLDKKEEKALEAARKQASDEEKDNETLQKKNEEFLKQQEDKAADELKSKEDQRNQQATFEKQQQEYNAKIRSLSDEIFAIQKAQQILIKKRQIDVANYKNMMLAASAKCTKDAKATVSSLDPNSTKASGLGSLQSKDKAVRDFYAACLDQETSRRITDAEQYKADMEKFDRQLANKTAELEEVKKSADSLSKMFQQAAIDAQNKKNQDDANFAKKQQAKWLEISQIGQNMMNKKTTNMQALAKAQSYTQQASNELAKLTSQKPIANKSPEDIRKEYITPFASSDKTFNQLHCDQVLGTGSSPSGKGGPTEGGTTK